MLDVGGHLDNTLASQLLHLAMDVMLDVGVQVVPPAMSSLDREAVHP
jgi:hypothetical protein